MANKTNYLNEIGKTLSESPSMLALVMDSIPQAIFWKDRHSVYIGCNRRFLNNAGKKTVDEIVGKTDYDLPWTKEEADFYREVDQRVMANNTAEYNIVQPQHRADGSFTWVSVSKIPLHDSEERVIGVLCTYEDITEQKHAEDALFKSEVRNRALLNAIPDMMFRISREGFFLDYKAEKDSDLMVPPEAFLHQHIRNVLPPELTDKTMHYVELALQTGTTQTYEYAIPAPAGEDVQHEDVQHYEARCTPCGEEEVLSIIRNITERKRADEERIHLQEEVIRAQREALRELATPLIPISEHVVVMPLIGTMDTWRVQQVMQTLLHGIEQRPTRLAILDVTGVTMVDTRVADGLLRIAHAAQLLGATVMLTGIRPDVAETIVGLGADLSGILTRGTLQEGIAYAIKMEGMHIHHHQAG